MPRKRSANELTANDVARIMDRCERALASTSRAQQILGQDMERLLHDRARLLAVIAQMQQRETW